MLRWAAVEALAVLVVLGSSMACRCFVAERIVIARIRTASLRNGQRGFCVALETFLKMGSQEDTGIVCPRATFGGKDSTAVKKMSILRQKLDLNET